MKLKILHNIISVGQSSFGLGTVAMGAASSQYALGHNTDVWSLDTPVVIKQIANKYSFPINKMHGFARHTQGESRFSTSMIRYALHENAKIYDVVHQHGLWGGNSVATLAMARFQNTPTIISPHGSLSPWALNKSKYIKKLALYEKINLRSASCLVATSELEINDFKDYKLSNPIAYIPNGISINNNVCVGNKSMFREKYKIPKNKRVCLFLSRITPKKGLMILINAIKMVGKNNSDWLFIIAGNDEGGYQQLVEEHIARLQLQNSVKIIGPQFDDWKQHAFSASELFILPSLSEGSPMVILECLAAGLPVITTKSSSWEDLVNFDCGWWTDIDEHSLAHSLNVALGMSPSQLREAGMRGKALVKKKYEWSRISELNIKLYRWLLHTDQRPDFIV